MTRRVVIRRSYPEPPQSMREVFTDPGYLRDKLRTVGGPRDELVSRTVNEHSVTIVLYHVVVWTGSDGTLHAIVNEAPAELTGTVWLEPALSGCVFGAQLLANVQLPLFSDKVEKIIAENVGKLLDAEYRFTLEWLHNGKA